MYMIVVLQIELGDADDVSSEEDEFKQAHEMRYARRSQSELSPARQENGNSNINETGGIVLNVKGIASEYLRRSWMPDRTVYTSKQRDSPVNGSVKASPNVSPNRKVDVVTVSNGLVHSDRNQQDGGLTVGQAQNGEPISPSKTPLTADYTDDSHDESENESDASSQVEEAELTPSALADETDPLDHTSDAGESEVADR